MLRLLVNKAKSHFNNALEYAERDRNEEAISELQNALDLDHSHVNSHVVLGTLYAKIGDPEKAAECWREALSLDPRQEKAHEYLNKVETAHRNLPVVRRQRLIITAQIVVMIVLGLILFMQFRPEGDRARLARAWDAYQARDYQKALAAIRQIQAAPGQSMAGEQADMLGKLIEAEQQLLLLSARKHLETEDYAQAHEEASQVLDMEPSGKIAAEARRIRAQAPARAVQNVSRKLEEFRQGETSAEAVREAIQTARDIPEPGVDEQFIAESEKRLETLVRTFQIEKLLADFQNKEIDKWTLLERLAELKKKYPDYETLTELIDRFYQPVREDLTNQFREAMDSGDLEKSAGVLKQIRRLFDTVSPRGDEQKVLSEFDSQLQQKKIADLNEKFRRALDEDNLEDATSLAKQLLAQEGLSEERSNQVQNQLDRLQPRLARKYWEWMVDRDWKYARNALSEDEAKKTIEYYPTVFEHLSRSAFPTSEDNMLFFLAVAHRTLGDRDKAIELLQRVKNEYPDSNVIDQVNEQLQQLRQQQ